MRSVRILRVPVFFIALLVCCVLSSCSTSPYNGTLACHTWRSMLTSRPDENSHFTSVALLSDKDVWLAGNNYAPGANVARALVEHWDGHHWQALFPTYPASYDVTINSIAAVSDSDVWIVGNAFSFAASATIPLAARWDGHTWHMLSSVSINNYAELNGVIALASDNVWAVGDTPGQTLIMHWDGSTWKRVSSPDIANESNRLISISALSSNDIWTVGTSSIYEGSPLTLIEHWDGSRWSIVPSPHSSRSISAFASVAAVSSNDVWAVGVLQQGQTSTALTSAGGYKQILDPIIIQTVGLIEHWDGQNWKVVSFPKLGQYQILTSVTAYSSQDVWAVGTYVVDSDHGQVLQGLLLHWDGSAWHSEEDSHAQYISGIATSAAGGLWSVGFALPPRNSPGFEQTLAEACM